MVEADAADGYEPTMFLPRTRFDPPAMFAELVQIAEQRIDDPALRPVCSLLVRDLRTLPELEQRLHFCLEEGGRVADRWRVTARDRRLGV